MFLQGISIERILLNVFKMLLHINCPVSCLDQTSVLELLKHNLCAPDTFMQRLVSQCEKLMKVIAMPWHKSDFFKFVSALCQKNFAGEIMTS